MTSEQLEDLFSGVGKVSKARVIMDRMTNRSKGFGFVEMDDESLGREAMEKLNEHDIGGRKIKISPAREPSRSSSHEPMVDYR